MISRGSAPFQLGVTYTATLAGELKFGGLSDATVYERYRDGRAFAWLIADILAHCFSNMILLRQESNDQQILRDTATGDRFRVKVMTRTERCDLSLSGMQGKDRGFNTPKYREHWDRELDGWIIADNRPLPGVIIAGFSKQRFVPPRHMLTADEWKTIAGGGRKRIYLP